MKKIIFIFFITTPFAQSFAECKNCNNTTHVVQSMVGFAKPISKPNINTNTEPRPNINNPVVGSGNIGHGKIKPKNKPKNTGKEIFNATTLSVAYGSTDKGLMSTTLTNGNTIVIGSSNANATGSKPTGTAQNFCLASYNISGQPNTSFGTKGATTTDFLSVTSNGQQTGSIDIPTAMSVLSNGNIIVAGNTNANIFNTGVFTQNNFALASYKSNGQLNTSFGTGGITITDFGETIDEFPGSTDTVVAMSVLQNGNLILLAGNTNLTPNGINSAFAIASYNSSGRLNRSFGKNGATRINFALTLNPTSLFSSVDILTGMTVLSNNKILLYGYSNAQDPNFDFAVARLMPNGQLDTSFNKTGIVLTNISTVIGS
ncbi:MAG: delta-60 repeat domain-containing protein [Candidatus Babeliales bacterium]|nr:delta-60 repeat domain-containing protein [Candidatus Babeliales bacterium]